MLVNVSSIDYIKEKTYPKENDNKMSIDDTKEKSIKNKKKIIIGEGGFGKVRFALSLFELDKVKAGEVICIKKTKEIGNIKYDGANKLKFKEIV